MKPLHHTVSALLILAGSAPGATICTGAAHRPSPESPALLAEWDVVGKAEPGQGDELCAEEVPADKLAAFAEDGKPDEKPGEQTGDESTGLAADDAKDASKGDKEEKHPENAAEQALDLGRKMLATINELWFLLASVSDREGADEAALRFTRLSTQLAELDSKLTAVCMEYEVLVSPEASELLNMRISPAFDDLGNEFSSLCRVRCYGSKRLIAAFRAASDAGLFPDEAIANLEELRPPLSAEEATAELCRLRKLLEPDTAVLRILSRVRDSDSASRSIAELKRLCEVFASLVPKEDTDDRPFPDESAAALQEVSVPLENTLWNIRAEIVRIAGLPGYDTLPYDAFSDTLDSVFENLNRTHSLWARDVFDASFRLDLAEALQEGSAARP